MNDRYIQFRHAGVAPLCLLGHRGGAVLVGYPMDERAPLMH